MQLNRCDIDGNIKPIKQILVGPAYTRVRLSNKQEADDIELFSKLWTPIEKNQRYTYFVLSGDIKAVETILRHEWVKAIRAIASELV